MRSRQATCAAMGRRPGAQSGRTWRGSQPARNGKVIGSFHACRYEKTSGTCAEPDHIAACPLPTHRLRNGHLNQIAYSLYLFIRTLPTGTWSAGSINRLDQANEFRCSRTLVASAHCLIEPLRMSTALRTRTSRWLFRHPDRRRRRSPEVVGVGAQHCARYPGRHFPAPDGDPEPVQGRPPRRAGCYRPGGCADIVRPVANQIDVGGSTGFPQLFPGSSNSRFGGIAASKASMSATATGSMTISVPKPALPPICICDRISPE